MYRYNGGFHDTVISFYLHSYESNVTYRVKTAYHRNHCSSNPLINQCEEDFSFIVNAFLPPERYGRNFCDPTNTSNFMLDDSNSSWTMVNTNDTSSDDFVTDEDNSNIALVIEVNLSDTICTLPVALQNIINTNNHYASKDGTGPRISEVILYSPDKVSQRDIIKSYTEWEHINQLSLKGLHVISDRNFIKTSNAEFIYHDNSHNEETTCKYLNNAAFLKFSDPNRNLGGFKIYFRIGTVDSSWIVVILITLVLLIPFLRFCYITRFIRRDIRNQDDIEDNDLFRSYPVRIQDKLSMYEVETRLPLIYFGITDLENTVKEFKGENNDDDNHDDINGDENDNRKHPNKMHQCLPIINKEENEQIQKEEKFSEFLTNAYKSCTTCSICITRFAKGEELRFLPRCGHIFHHSCILPWLTEQKNTCPLCQIPAFDVDNAAELH